MAREPAKPRPTDPSEYSSSDQLVGFFNGQWLPQSDLRLSITDDGVRFAATAVERLRTYRGKVFQLPAHLRRLRDTLDAIGIVGTPSDASIEQFIDELLNRNAARVGRHGDVGITIVATPGVRHNQPTIAMHLNLIDHDQVLNRRHHGQPLVITDVVQPSPSSWPRGIKVRCRLHYYLADQIARRSHVDASGVLLDEDGSITETSIANIAIVKGGTILSPPQDRVLGGITQQVVQRIAEQRSIVWTKRPVQPRELKDADEVILMGTDTGIWCASQVNGKVIAGGSAGPVYSILLSGFDEFVGQES